MSKRRKRPYRDRHHIAFEARDWTSRKAAETIRDNPWLIAPVDRDAHEDLHRACPAVPLPNYNTLVRINNIFHPVEGDYLGTMDKLMNCIETAISHRKTKPLEAELGRLTIAAIELQKPFIKEGLYYGEA